MIKKVAIILVIALVVAGLAIVAIAKYQRVVKPAIARGLAVATESGGLANLEADTLIAADNATTAPEFAKGNWINSEPLTIEKLPSYSSSSGPSPAITAATRCPRLRSGTSSIAIAD